jgi:replicative DNA helicase
MKTEALEIEQLLLSILIIDNSVFFLSDINIEPFFARRTHQLIYQKIVQSMKKYHAVDALMINALFSTEEQAIAYVEIEQPVSDYLNALVDAYASSSNFLTYLATLRETYQVRRLSDEVTRLNDKLNYTDDLTILVDDFYSKITDIVSLNPKKYLYNSKNILEMIDTSTEYISFQNNSFNKMFGGGLGRGELFFLAGLTGMGKTSVAIDMLFNLNNYKCLLFSLEMSITDIKGRIKARGNLNSDDLQNIVICDDSAININSLERYINQMKLHHNGIDVVFIDYIGLMQRQTNKTEYETLLHYTRELKLLAKKHNIAIICLAQVNRSYSLRKDKRLLLSDFKGSSSMEQDADGVIFIHREEYFLKDNTPKAVQYIVEIDVAKMRRYKVGTYLYQINLASNRIFDISTTQVMNYNLALNSHRDDNKQFAT